MDLSTTRSSKTGPEATRAIRNAGITAGVALLLMAALAGFGALGVVEGLVTPGDAAQTATDITAAEGVFRLGIASLLLVIALDVVVAWALYRVFRPVSDGLSTLAAGFRLVYAGVFLVAIAQLTGVPRLLGDEDAYAALGTDQVHARALARIETFHDIWDAGFVLFGLHLLLIGYLAFRSGYLPRFLGVLLGIAGFGYVFDTFAAVLAPGSLPELSMVTGIFEVLLALWLVIRGRRLAVHDSGHLDAPTAPST